MSFKMQIPLLLSAISHLYINVSEFIRHPSQVNLEEGMVQMNSAAAETWKDEVLRAGAWRITGPALEFCLKAMLSVFNTLICIYKHT